MPLGGVGAGKLEISNNCHLENFTIMNNWTYPYPGFVGNHFGVVVEREGERKGFFLQRKAGKFCEVPPETDLPSVDEIEYEGGYPVARIRLIRAGTDIDIVLTAMTFFCPGDYGNSSLPTCLLEFKVKNTSATSVARVKLATGMKNIAGTSQVGRLNEEISGKTLKGIRFLSTARSVEDQSFGCVSLVVPKEAGPVEMLRQYNTKVRPWPLTEDFSPWLELFSMGSLPRQTMIGPVAGHAQDPAGIVATSVELGPGEEKVVPFVLSWWFNVPWALFPYKHHYGERFRDSASVARYVVKHLDALKGGTLRFRDLVEGCLMPPWLKDALMNNLYVYSSSTWLTKEGKFSFYEAPVMGPMMGTLDVRFYSSNALVKMFPEWEKSELLQFAKAQRPDGYVPHDLGWSRLDSAGDGTTAPPRWKDLNSKFILMVYRDYVWTGDRRFLKTMYPHVKRAFRWIRRMDKDGDGLPENEGADQTFDNWPFYGVNSYTSSIYLTALKALPRLARAMRDKETRRIAEREFERAQASFDRKLWTGSYFRAASSTSGNYDACTTAQLIGQWFAHLVGLGYILDPSKVKMAVESIWRLNAAPFKYIMANSVLADGSIDESNPHSMNGWPGVTYACSSLMIREGMVDQGLEAARRAWGNFTDNVKSPWNQPDVIKYDDGSFGWGDHYMRNTAVWTIIDSLLGLECDMVSRCLRASPTMGSISAPLIFPGLIARLSHELRDDRAEYVLELKNEVDLSELSLDAKGKVVSVDLSGAIHASETRKDEKSVALMGVKLGPGRAIVSIERT